MRSTASLTRKIIVGGAILASVGAASPASAQGAQKFGLVGPQANLYCHDLEPYAGENATETVRGFVIFNVDDDSDMLSAVVSLKRARPSTVFQVRLIQSGGDDSCATTDGLLTTNRRGNGTLALREPDVGTRAQVFIEASSLDDEPLAYRATTYFRTG